MITERNNPYLSQTRAIPFKIIATYIRKTKPYHTAG